MIFDDEPYTLLEDGPDYLSVRTRLDTLVNSLRRRREKTPISIGLFGPYGSGKSSALRYLINKLRPDNHCITLHPWRYDHNTDIRRHILADLIISDSRATDINALRESSRKLLDAFSGEVSLGFIKLGIAGDKLNEPHHLTVDIASLNYFKEEFTNFLHVSTQDSCLYILVDDLDRCSPHVAASTLTCLTTYCRTENVVTIVACDYDILKEQLKIAWQDHGPSFRDNFLDKFFQHEIQIGFPLSGIHLLTHSLITSLHEDSETKEIGRILESHIETLSTTCSNNPRSLKRLITSIVQLMLENDDFASEKQQTREDILSYCLLRHMELISNSGVGFSPEQFVYLNRIKEYLRQGIEGVTASELDGLITLADDSDSMRHKFSGSGIPNREALISILQQYPDSRRIIGKLSEKVVRDAINIGAFHIPWDMVNAKLPLYDQNRIRNAIANSPQQLRTLIDSMDHRERFAGFRFAGQICITEINDISHWKELLGVPTVEHGGFLLGIVDCLDEQQFKHFWNQLEIQQKGVILYQLPYCRYPSHILQVPDIGSVHESDEYNRGAIGALLACDTTNSETLLITLLEHLIAVQPHIFLQAGYKFGHLARRPKTALQAIFSLEQFHLVESDFLSGLLRSWCNSSEWSDIGDMILDKIRTQPSKQSNLEEFLISLGSRGATGARWLVNCKNRQLFNDEAIVHPLLNILQFLRDDGYQNLEILVSDQIRLKATAHVKSHPSRYLAEFVNSFPIVDNGF
jgi:hypothetical protein